MARGSGNPMQAHHKQKRLKEIKKNKQERVKARDERVVQTKTVDSVKEEIQNLKRRKNLQPSEQQKLQRLEKELKLVQAATVNKPQSYQPQNEREQAKPLTELDDPRKSVYYDEKLNPYGAPPPRQPRLYHQLGGGVTMDIRYAVVPGEEPPLSPPPPPPPPSTKLHKLPPTRDALPPLPKEPPPREMIPDLFPPSPPPSPQQDHTRDVKKLTIPDLPPPSQVVKRVLRGKASFDIWASTEEVEYERCANQIDLEGDQIGAAAPAKKPKKKKKPPLEFYYQDMSYQIQGPFQKAQMLEWMQAGFFPPSTLVKTSRNENWLQIARVPLLQREESPSHAGEDSIPNRIAALKENSGIQDRISQLKNADKNTADFTVQDRIAALKDSMKADQWDPGDDVGRNDLPSKEVISEQKLTNDLNGENHDETRIAPEALPPQPPPPPRSRLLHPSDGAPSYPMQDEAQSYPTHDAAPYPVEDGDEPPAYPAPYPLDDRNGNERPAYPASYLLENGDEPPAYPAPYALGEEDGDEAPVYPSPYPLEALEEQPTMNADDTAIPNFHHGATSDIPYPDDTAYPVTEVYPVTDTYPAMGETDVSNSDGPPFYPMEPPAESSTKKTIEVDKDVAAFMPSHLRNRKRKPNSSETTKSKKAKPGSKHPRDNSDDYEKFMEEIEELDAT